MIDELLNNKTKLENKYNQFIKQRQILKKDNTKNLVEAHIRKAEHNLEVLSQLTSKFNDWKIISLYYALYHSCLALLANKGFVSKNHTATLIFIMKYYIEINKDEIDLIEDLQVKEQDAIFYTELKNKRHEANYSTNLFFNDEQIEFDYKKTILFLNKVKDILKM